MRVAVPLYEEVVAPRFGFAEDFLVATIENEGISETHRIILPNNGWNERLRVLEEHGVSVILCGGFNRRFEPLARSHGIRVICGCVGEAELVAHRFAQQKQEDLAWLGE